MSLLRGRQTVSCKHSWHRNKNFESYNLYFWMRNEEQKRFWVHFKENYKLFFLFRVYYEN